jgi:hypothetical protein
MLAQQIKEERPMFDDVRRYSIEIKDVVTDQSVLLTAADWTKEEVEVVSVQAMHLAGFGKCGRELLAARWRGVNGSWRAQLRNVRSPASVVMIQDFQSDDPPPP